MAWENFYYYFYYYYYYYYYCYTCSIFYCGKYYTEVLEELLFATIGYMCGMCLYNVWVSY